MTKYNPPKNWFVKMTIYSKIKLWIWFNIITKYWGDYIQDTINDSNERYYDNDYENIWNDLD